jgi:murein DD-endopeptidase MepM/ murein hydrolase activator NlpD
MTDKKLTSNFPFDENPLDPSEKQNSKPSASKGFGFYWERILHMGLGEIAIKVGTGLLLVALVVLVIWVMGRFYLRGTQVSAAAINPADSTLSPTELAPAVSTPAYELVVAANGILRSADVHTILPDRPRYDVIKYTVQPGDNVFGIAEKFGLRPSTILYGNLEILAGNVDLLTPGQELNILPVDGYYYRWNAGDGLNGVATFLGVKPEDIINFAGNHLKAENIGDYAHPNIPPDTLLIIPGGHGSIISWTGYRITRDNPAEAKVFGPGFCGVVQDGPVGTGSWGWPTVQHYLSGYDFSPETNHWGVDIGGALGSAIYAADSGVVVYAGFNTHGYGNVVVIDHGGGMQTLYAHLMDGMNVSCGSFVAKGDIIAAMGLTGNTTGPHLHYEMWVGNTRVDPNIYYAFDKR